MALQPVRSTDSWAIIASACHLIGNQENASAVGRAANNIMYCTTNGTTENAALHARGYHDNSRSWLSSQEYIPYLSPICSIKK